MLRQDELERLVEEFSRIVQSFPQVFLAHLNIIVRRTLHKGFSQEHLEKMHAIYAQHVNAFDYLSLPTAKPYAMVELDVTGPPRGDPNFSEGKHKAALVLRHVDGEVRLGVQVRYPRF